MANVNISGFTEKVTPELTDIMTFGVGEFWFRNTMAQFLTFVQDNITVGVSASGTPVNDQLAVWTNANTIEGTIDLTFNATDFTITNHDFLVTNSSAAKITSLGTSASVELQASSGGSNEKIYRFLNNGLGNMQLNTYTDVGVFAATVFEVNRTGTTVDNIDFNGNNLIGIDEITPVGGGAAQLVINTDDLAVLSAGSTNAFLGMDTSGGGTNDSSTVYAATTAGTLAMISKGSTATGTTFGLSNNSLSAITSGSGTPSNFAIGSVTSHPVVFGTNNIVSATIDTTQDWDFQSNTLENILSVRTGQVIVDNILILDGNSLNLNTIDGTDDDTLILNGGGALGPTRGASILIHGNESSADLGNLELKAGDATDGNIIFNTGNTDVAQIDNTGNWGFNGHDLSGINDLTFDDTGNIIFDTTTGTQIATATSQKLAFYGSTPIIQVTTGITAGAFTANTSGIVDDSATFDGYTIGQMAAALRVYGILA